MDINEVIKEMTLNENELLIEYANKIKGIKDFLQRNGNELLDIRFSQNEGLVGVVKNDFLDLFLIGRDKDGLCNWEDLVKSIHDVGGYFEFEFFFMKLTKYLKENFNNLNWYHSEFIKDFYRLDKSSIRALICVDNLEFRIDEPKPIFLANMHFGAKFNNNIAEIPDGLIKLKSDNVDLTVSDEKLFKNLFRSNYSLDIKWNTKDQIKTFQALEYKYEDVFVEFDSIKKHPVRYIHAEFNLIKNCFQHFDGAIHFYEEDHYFQKRDQNFDYDVNFISGRKASSKKVFRLDGDIRVEDWCKLTSSFFDSNPLLHEYFTGEYPQFIRKILGLDAT